MAKPRGIFRRVIEAIFKPTPPPRKTPPKPPKAPRPAPSEPIRPDRVTLQRRALNHILDELEFAKRESVQKRLRFMTIDELLWTIRADTIELQTAASQNPDRIDDRQVPLNPWWYK